ncbi:hypothetical protein LTR17_027745, partial [Elasticomyces elasticus]
SIFQRKENYNHEHRIFQARLINSVGISAGFIYTPDPATMTAQQARKLSGVRVFIVISRASLNADPRADEVSLSDDLRLFWGSADVSQLIAISSGAERCTERAPCLDEQAHFDITIYDASRPWCLFNVLMIETLGDHQERIAAGRIQIGAFLHESSMEREVWLG